MDIANQKMDLNKKKEQFNIAYVYAIAAQVGVNTSNLTVDDDSVDLSLVGKGYSGIVRNPQIDLQLKCTSQNLINGDTLKFPLKKKNYDDLRGDNVLSPRYLVVLVVPSADIDWLEHKDDHMVARNLCYWISIKDFPETTNDTSITLEIPITQRFNSTTLKNLMECASKRVDPC